MPAGTGQRLATDAANRLTPRFQRLDVVKPFVRVHPGTDQYPQRFRVFRLDARDRHRVNLIGPRQPALIPSGLQALADAIDREVRGSVVERVGYQVGYVRPEVINLITLETAEICLQIHVPVFSMMMPVTGGQTLPPIW